MQTITKLRCLSPQEAATPVKVDEMCEGPVKGVTGQLWLHLSQAAVPNTADWVA